MLQCATVTDVTFRIHFLHSFYTSKHTQGTRTAATASPLPSPQPSPPEEACRPRRRIDTVHPSSSPSSIPVQFSRSLPSPLTLANAPELNRALLMGSLRAPPAPAPLVGSARVLFGSGLRCASARVLKPRGARVLAYIFLLLLPATGSQCCWLTSVERRVAS